jgi:DNA-binding NarL/FixJ family response regulator
MEVGNTMQGQSVLIVDRLSETREVLRAVLERRGLQIFEASEQAEGWELVRRHHPDLIVIDLEESQPPVPSDGFTPQFDGNLDAVPILLLGSARWKPRSGPGGLYFSKPFQYIDLIHKIDELLAHRQEAPRTGNGQAEAPHRP